MENVRWINIYFNPDLKRLEWGEYETAERAKYFTVTPPFEWKFIDSIKVVLPGEKVLLHSWPKLAKRVAARVLEVAKEAAENAAQSGRMDDGGADTLRQSAYSFIAGLDHYFPPTKVWQDAEQYIKNRDDPEHKEYLRLKKKFEG